MLIIPQIQTALTAAHITGWLFYDFRRSNTIAYDVLALPSEMMVTRRWFYFVPAVGEPVKITHAIEHWSLDSLPGIKKIYSSWKSLREILAETLRGAATVAMEYSPMAAIPTVACVDGGTLELVRSCGPTVVSSADFVQQFQAVWSDQQITDNLAAAKVMRRLVDESFRLIRDALRSKKKITEFDVQQFLVRAYAAEHLTAADAPICAVNANAALPHYAPSAERHEEIKIGDIVLLDFWAKPDKSDGTYVDITWMAVADSSPSAEYEKVFGIVRDARDAALELVRDRFSKGKIVRGFEVDDASRNVIVGAGYGDQFVHRTGHSIYTEDHGRGANMDNFETHDDRAILPRTSFSIEPGIYLEGKFGVRSEIDVVISPKGEVLVPIEPIQREIVRIL